MTYQSTALKLIQVLQCYMFPESGRQETLQIPTYNLTGSDILSPDFVHSLCSEEWKLGGR